MTSIEVLATIFAALILIKLIVVLIKPEVWIKISKALLKKSVLTTLIYLVLAAIVGNYILASVDAIQIAAVMLFTSLLMAIGFIPYSNMIDKMREQVMNEGISKAWLSILIWLAIAIWILYKVFI